MVHWRIVALLGALTGVVGGCSSDQGAPTGAPTGTGPAKADAVADVDPAELPPEVRNVVAIAAPDMKITSAERKERDGRIYYDVEGARPDGSEMELDLLSEGNAFKVVEIQRDIAWAEAPESARVAAAAAPATFEPVRVIESTQTDGSVIYELFAQGAPEKPSLEVRVVDGKAEVLKEQWMH